MKSGINAGFGELLGKDNLDELQLLGAYLVRTSAALTISEYDLDALLQEFVGRPFVPLIILASDIGLPPHITADDMAGLSVRVVDSAIRVGLQDYWLECGNEPDLGWSERKPQLAADCVREVYRAVKAAGSPATIISGGVSTTDKRGRDYLKAMSWKSLPLDVLVGVHRYAPHMEVDRPFSGFDNREEEVTAIREIVGRRQLAHTEGGYHTVKIGGGFWFWKWSTQLNNFQAADSLRKELDFWLQQDAACCSVYQWNDGPDPTNTADRFGLRESVGQTWKPQAYAVPSWIEHH